MTVLMNRRNLQYTLNRPIYNKLRDKETAFAVKSQIIDSSTVRDFDIQVVDIPSSQDLSSVQTPPMSAGSY